MNFIQKAMEKMLIEEGATPESAWLAASIICSGGTITEAKEVLIDQNED